MSFSRGIIRSDRWGGVGLFSRKIDTMKTKK